MYICGIEIRDNNNQKLKVMTKEIKTAIYFVQETIGGWKQNAVFNGTFEECQEYVTERCHNGSFNIVADCDYTVDYL